MKKQDFPSSRAPRPRPWLRLPLDPQRADPGPPESRTAWRGPESWLALVRGVLLRQGSRRLAAVFLDEAVEREVDEAFESSPSAGLALDLAARELLMAQVRRVSPGVSRAGCAPLPEVDEALAQALAEAGLPVSPQGLPRRRYAVLTTQGPVASCRECRLRRECPRVSRPAPGRLAAEDRGDASCEPV